MQQKADIILEKGMVIVGKWNHSKYTVVREIGRGMIGTVYLCKMGEKLVALKMGTSPMALSREAMILKTFNRVQDHRLGPFLFDVDDWQRGPKEIYPFYVMEYIVGISLTDFIRLRGSKWIGTMLVQMLKTLERLHAMGLVFGDLKNDNLIVTENPLTLRFVDVGGVTKKGQSIKEYSNFYDRAYWYLGTRKAEASYDLFALVMVLLAIYYPKQFARTKNPKQQLYRHLSSIPALRPYEVILKKGLSGDYASAKAMRANIGRLHQQVKARQHQTKSVLPQALIITVIAGIYYSLSYYFF